MGRMEWTHRKDFFMKNNIMTTEHLMDCKVIEFLSFLACRITKKNTTFGSECKFVGSMHMSSTCKIPKNLKMRMSRDLATKQFKKGLSRKKWCEWTNNDMNGSENAFCPKLQRETYLKAKSSCWIKNVSMFTFYKPILLYRRKNVDELCTFI